MADLNDIIGRFGDSLKGERSISVDLSTSKVILALRKKYSFIYPKFIEQIMDQDAKIRRPHYKKIIADMKKVVELSDVLLGEKGRLASGKETQLYLDTIKSLDDRLTGLMDMAKKNSRLRKTLNKVEDFTNIQMGSLKQVTSIFRENIERRQQRQGGLIDGLSRAGGIAQGALEGRGKFGGSGTRDALLGVTLGPLAPLATYGITAAGRMAGRALAQRRMRRMAGGEIGLLGRTLGVSQDDALRFSQTTQSRNLLGKRIRNPFSPSVGDLYSQYGGIFGGAASSDTQGSPGLLETVGNISKKAKFNSAAGVIGGVSKKDYIAHNAEALKTFYTKGAFQAPYTKRLLAAVEGKKVSKENGSNNGFSGFMGGIASRLGPGLMAAGIAGLKGLGIAGAGLIGYTIGSKLRKMFPVIDEIATDFISGMINTFRGTIKAFITAVPMALRGDLLSQEVVRSGMIPGVTDEKKSAKDKALDFLFPQRLKIRAQTQEQQVNRARAYYSGSASAVAGDISSVDLGVVEIRKGLKELSESIKNSQNRKQEVVVSGSGSKKMEDPLTDAINFGSFGGV